KKKKKRKKKKKFLINFGIKFLFLKKKYLKNKKKNIRWIGGNNMDQSGNWQVKNYIETATG
ncbi:hypothetical protein, partial [Escherichia coli]|uniref:hypothetical protein n=1 Tax=Escherichia coli TaxID=562 RepID=UPI001485015D